MDAVIPLRRRALEWVFAVTLLLAFGPVSASQSPGAPGQAAAPSEYEVKAAFLLNFTKFIEWSAETHAAEGPFTICILGSDPFGAVIDQLVDGESVGRRAIAVRRLREPARGCELLFIGKSERGAARAIASAGNGVLTVGETDDFLQQGGAIAFVIENRRVRFDVNERAALRKGLRISSRLLNVARVVER